MVKRLFNRWSSHERLFNHPNFDPSKISRAKSVLSSIESTRGAVNPKATTFSVVSFRWPDQILACPALVAARAPAPHTRGREERRCER